MELQMNEMTEANFDTMYEWYKDPAYAVFFRHTPDNLSRDMLKIVFTVISVVLRVDLPNKQMAGIISVAVNDKTHIANMGVLIEKSLQSKGLGRQVTKQVVDYLFNQDPVKRIVMYATEPNVITALKKGGMFEECRLHKSTFYNGKLHTESRMVITKDFYLKCKERK